ncbi:hypothetical protein F4779DRAFT_632961 [Xylariaceae sp. FL0662B]|nr:hypothetical protein F4779DRAFT_632961 [Xylariaceae sp. FL0662B]
MRTTFTKATGFAAAVGVWGHAVMQEPTPRKAGSAQEALCGSAVTTALEKDIAGPIEDALDKADADYKCNAYLCRGYQYEDNIDNVHAVTSGELLTFHIDLIAGHKPGYANVSVVNLATNEVIGEPLRLWSAWPDSTSGPPRDDIDFNVTIPDTLGSACAQGGKCALQWYWWSISNSQTYESCLDFYVET